MNKTSWVYLGATFYGILFLFLSLIPVGADTTTSDGTIDLDDTRFLANTTFISNIKELPALINVIIFAPLITVFTFLIVTTALGFIFDGGS